MLTIGDTHVFEIKKWKFNFYWVLGLKNEDTLFIAAKATSWLKIWFCFVKDKKLDASDIVLFKRGVGDLSKDLLFIDLSRRPYYHHDHPL